MNDTIKLEYDCSVDNVRADIDNWIVYINYPGGCLRVLVDKIAAKPRIGDIAHIVIELPRR